MSESFESKNDISPNLVEVLYKDENLIVVNKPSGVLVHPYKSKSRQKRNLMKIVRDQISQYVYPIHRLDRPVSGIVMFGLNGKVVREIKEAWHNQETLKEYITLCRGVPPESGRFDFTLQNSQKIKQAALTEFWPIHHFGDEYTLLKVRIRTGRKHQIRRHFSRPRHNIIGDTTYGNGKINQFFRDEYNLQRIFLHSFRLELVHPYENKMLKLYAPLSEDLLFVLDKMGLDKSKTSRIIENSLK